MFDGKCSQAHLVVKPHSIITYKDNTHCIFRLCSAAMTASESALAISQNTTAIKEYSVQELVDCCNSDAAGATYSNDQGCNFGDSGDAFLFMTKYTIATVSVHLFHLGCRIVVV